MEFIRTYLASHAECAVFLCLGLGYLAGHIKIGAFKLGATVGTLLVSLLVGQLVEFSISDQLKSTFFIMFTFVLGYESGPAFFSNIRSSGLKAVLLALFYGVVTFVTMLATCKLMGYDKGTAAGMLAGAQTQSSVLGAVKGDEVSNAAATVAYALTYIFGTVGAILFVKKIGPAIMRINLAQAVQNKTDASGGPDLTDKITLAAPVQVRAYVVEADSAYVGQTVAEVENRAIGGMQIEALHRQGKELPLEEQCAVQAGDVLTVIGLVNAINVFDEDHLTETTDPACLQLKLSTVELIVTAEDTAQVVSLLDQKGILLKNVVRNGKPMPEGEPIRTGDRLMLTGAEHAVRSVVQQLGYIRDTGDAADIPFFSLAVVLGIVLGSFYLNLNSVPLSLGASGGTLVLGLISGWINQKHPKYCYIPSGARWFVRSIGLNLFIAVTALNAAKALGSAIGWHCLPLLAVGIVVTLAPMTVSLLFGHRVLKMDPVDVLGGLCGSGTSTPALNALTEETESTAFTSCYSPAYAVGNILLTVVGILLSLLL